MHTRLLSRLFFVMLLLPTPLLAQLRFQEGRHYDVIAKPQVSGTVPAGKIEVAEVFSYVCGACFQAHKMVGELAAKLPTDAAMAYVHAGFNRGWPLFQRAHLTAQALKLPSSHHEQLFHAIWETAEFPYFDRATGRPSTTEPVMRDFARFHAKAGGVTEEAFVKKAGSPEIDKAVAHTEALIKAWQVGSTPSFVVAGRYRINNDAVSSFGDLQSIVTYLIGLERNRLKAQAPQKN